MVNFAELKAKAEKVKDAGVTKMTDTRDKYSSVPSSKTNWDPNWKRSPPPPASSPTPGPPPPPAPPQRSRPDVFSQGPPVVPRASRPLDVPAPPTYTPLRPPTRSASGYPPSQTQIDKIDWTNLSPEDKEAFFDWLDEFFSRYLHVELGPRPSNAAHGTPAARLPPSVNMATRPSLA
ncbi:hypothetical protein F5I97DRAFT_432247 [Phlebopus sp. FC_14]|nr:hypothetical protein F5I97DRAFT_432247 [Phlebopus sp. FC_14]